MSSWETYFGEILKKHGKIKEYNYSGLSYSDSEPYVISKPANRDLVILNITDNHFSDYDIRFFMGLAGARTIKKMIKFVKPDLITVTGDIVCGTASDKSIKRFCKLMESAGVPWAPVYGNHDDETNCSLEYLTEQMIESPHCIMKVGPEGMRIGNYVININSASGKTVQTLFMVDSSHSQPNDRQTEWIIEKAATIDTEQVAVMMHIPLPEYQIVYDEFYDKKTKSWKPGSRGCGESHESVCCEKNQDGTPAVKGFVIKLLQQMPLKNIFCGHEHMNNWSAVYNGVRLTYTMKVGRGSGFYPWFNGATVIFVGDKGIHRIQQITHSSFKNIILEDINTDE